MSTKLRKLSQFVFVHSPGKTPASTSSITTAPKLIIIASWMDAGDRHIAPLITHYGSLYPTSRILLIKFIFRQMLSTIGAADAVQPAVTYLQSQEANGYLSTQPSRPEILVHAFSNGGVASTKQLYEGYRRATGRVFPLHATIFDSGPGQYSYSNTQDAVMAGIPRGPWRAVIAIFVHLLNVYFWIVVNLGYPYALVGNASFHNDPAGNHETNRAYIYGAEDKMVNWRHIEAHAQQAEEHGFLVRRAKFANSPHVGHARADGLRYWKIVAQTWESGRRLSHEKSDEYMYL